MADPLSLAASIIAVVTLGAQLTRIVGIFRDNNKAAPPELVELGAEVLSLRLILQRIKNLRVEEDSAGRLEQGIDIHVTLQNCNDAVQAAGNKVDALERLLQGGTRDRLYVAFSASSFRQDFRDLLARLERSKTSLLLSLQLINLNGWKTAGNAASYQKISECSNASSETVSISTSQTELALDLHAISSLVSEGGSEEDSQIEVHSSIASWLSGFRPSDLDRRDGS